MPETRGLLGWLSTGTLGFQCGYSSWAVWESAGAVRLPSSLHSSFPQGARPALYFVSCLRNGGAGTHGLRLLASYRNGRVRGRKEAKPAGVGAMESLDVFGGSESRSDHCRVQGLIPARCPRSPHRTPLAGCQGTEQPAKHHLWPGSRGEGPGPGEAVRLGVSGSAAGAGGKDQGSSRCQGGPPPRGPLGPSQGSAGGPWPGPGSSATRSHPTPTWTASSQGSGSQCLGN